MDPLPSASCARLAGDDTARPYGMALLGRGPPRRRRGSPGGSSRPRRSLPFASGRAALAGPPRRPWTSLAGAQIHLPSQADPSIAGTFDSRRFGRLFPLGGSALLPLRVWFDPSLA